MVEASATFGQRAHRRSFLYVENFAAAIFVASTHPAASRRTFYVADEGSVSTSQLVRALAPLTGSPSLIVPFPVAWLRGLGSLGSFFQRATGRTLVVDREAVEKLCGDLEVDARPFRQACGWLPRYSLDAALREAFIKEADTARPRVAADG